MNKQTKALKRALDWIEGNGKYDAAKRIAQAIREALAEQPAIKQDLTPEQPDMNLNCKSVQARLATSWGYVKAEQPAPVAESRKPQQEPVACANGCRGFVKHSTPAQRTWVGFTDEEIIAMRHLRDWTAGWTDITYTRAIEAKLKEKNSP